jgi:ketosteroid isomerase-like protein
MNKIIWASLAIVVASASACSSVSTEAAAAPPLAARAAPALDQNVQQQVIQVVKDWINAVPKRDTERIGQVLADDFVAILWDGKKRSKAEYLEELRSGKYAVESIALDETEARILGDTAIVTYYQSEKSKSAGLDSSGGSVWTDILTRRDGRWQVVAEHGSRF